MTFSCLAAGCTAKPFTRSADLDRHYKHNHTRSGAETYNCDYRKCKRSTGNLCFGRKDHFRDHLREYHREDLIKRGGSDARSQLADRRIDPKWWRCSKCLVRVEVAAHEYDCPDCKVRCERERQRAREELA